MKRKVKSSVPSKSRKKLKKNLNKPVVENKSDIKVWNDKLLDVLEHSRQVNKKSIDNGIVNASKGSLYVLHGTILHCSKNKFKHIFTIQVFDLKKTIEIMESLTEPERHLKHKGYLMSIKEILSESDLSMSEKEIAIRLPINDREKSEVHEGGEKLKFILRDGDIIKLSVYDSKIEVKGVPKITDLELKKFDKVTFHNVKCVKQKLKNDQERDGFFNSATRVKLYERRKIMKNMSMVQDERYRMSKLALQFMGNPIPSNKSIVELNRYNVFMTDTKFFLKDVLGYKSKLLNKHKIGRIDVNHMFQPIKYDSQIEKKENIFFSYDILYYQTIKPLAGIDTRLIVSTGDANSCGISTPKRVIDLLSHNRPAMIAITKPGGKKVNLYSEEYNESTTGLSYEEFTQECSKISLIYPGVTDGAYIDMLGLLTRSGIELSRNLVELYIKIKLNSEFTSGDDKKLIIPLDKSRKKIVLKDAIETGIIHIDELNGCDIGKLISDDSWKPYFLAGHLNWGMDWVHANIKKIPKGVRRDDLIQSGLSSTEKYPIDEERFEDFIRITGNFEFYLNESRNYKGEMTDNTYSTSLWFVKI